MPKPNNCCNCRSDNWRLLEPPDKYPEGSTFAVLQVNLTKYSGAEVETINFDMYLCETCGNGMYMKKD